MNLPKKPELTAPAPPVREPVLQAIGTNLLQAPTKLTSGWVDAAAKLIEQLLAERQHLYTDAAGAWPAPETRPFVVLLTVPESGQGLTTGCTQAAFELPAGEYELYARRAAS